MEAEFWSLRAPRVGALVGTLLVMGLGAGAVVSPNLALSLAKDPTRMAGAAGAAFQSGQRMGGALGAAVMMTVYELGAFLRGSGGGAPGLSSAGGRFNSAEPMRISSRPMSAAARWRQVPVFARERGRRKKGLT